MIVQRHFWRVCLNKVLFFNRRVSAEYSNQIATQIKAMKHPDSWIKLTSYLENVRNPEVFINYDINSSENLNDLFWKSGLKIKTNWDLNGANCWNLNKQMLNIYNHFRWFHYILVHQNLSLKPNSWYFLFVSLKTAPSHSSFLSHLEKVSTRFSLVASSHFLSKNNIFSAENGNVFLAHGTQLSWVEATGTKSRKS